MISTSAILIVSGIACLCLTGVITYAISPRKDKSPPPWTSTDARASASALGLMLLIMAGSGLLAKGAFA